MPLRLQQTPTPIQRAVLVRRSIKYGLIGMLSTNPTRLTDIRRKLGRPDRILKTTSSIVNKGLFCFFSRLTTLVGGGVFTTKPMTNRPTHRENPEESRSIKFLNSVRANMYSRIIT